MKRFKKLLPIAATLALVLTLLVPMTALAADLTSVSDTLTDYTKSAANPKHTIAFTTPTEIAIGSTITITLPAEFTGIGSIVDADVTVTYAGETTSSEAGSGQVITVTTAAAVVSASSAVSVVIGDGAEGGLNDITNPSVAGTYTITIATPTEGDSGSCDVNITETGTTTVTGNLPAVIEVTAPTAVTMPSLDPSTSPIEGSSSNVFVDANGTDTWTLYAHEADGDGKMASGGNTLGAAMQVTVTDAGEGITSLSGTAEAIDTHVAASDNMVVTFTQVVAYTDTVADTYTITVTFTVGYDA